MMPDSMTACAPAPGGRHVFVYGTLRAGGRNDINRLQPPPRYIGAAEVRDMLYRIDWYPGLVLDAAGGRVFGEVYAINAELEAQLDAIECVGPGDDNEYRKRELRLAVNGMVLDCLVYEIDSSRIVGKARIVNGDWIASHAGEAGFHDAQ